ncbi:MAG: DUF1287 domain-containing protein [Candidatus Krumholzibacteria bacterium]|nr:DUF1287 domain-containing protein [Candidatus Krumholzibacteria bacterium]
MINKETYLTGSWTSLGIALLVLVSAAGAVPEARHPHSAGADPENDDVIVALVKAAKERTLHEVTYNGAYFPISYPNGDIPSNFGVCTDLVIRAFRKAGVDLQKKVHEDMAENFNLYPSGRIWGLTRPDKNIDHRRVPNLQVFFKRAGVSLEISGDAKDYLPGDLVTWMLPGNLPHIGIVIDEWASDGGRPLIAHNIGEGPKINDILFDYPITGHYRYTGR